MHLVLRDLADVLPIMLLGAAVLHGAWLRFRLLQALRRIEELERGPAAGAAEDGRMAPCSRS